MAKCGYVCVNCGQCKGKLRAPITVRRCIACDFENAKGATECARCGASLVFQAGVSNTIVGGPAGQVAAPGARAASTTTR